ncbi:hypothetical protein CHS0354_004479 [Potamilus streckersoni]|uniref:Uncharacterized protein n=1 Tax=Potamilus streckersoni TaxID=2493646 RepID=A0AAE0SPB4_9BIVA|nr:hypothetical protein CHS0354_004479 [Potamilus streckersoni]
MDSAGDRENTKDLIHAVVKNRNDLENPSVNTYHLNIYLTVELKLTKIVATNDLDDNGTLHIVCDRHHHETHHIPHDLRRDYKTHPRVIIAVAGREGKGRAKYFCHLEPLVVEGSDQILS